MKKYIYLALIVYLTIGGFTSCKEEDMGDTIFDTTEKPLDPESYTYELDYFLQENFLKPFNIKFQYRMADVSINMDYNLVPCEYDKAVDMAVLTKYFWLDVFSETCGDDFLKLYAPRIIHLIGSAAVNPTTGTEEKGLAESSTKLTLYKINKLDLNDTNSMYNDYFTTIYRVYAQILCQNKNYPVEFNEISLAQYDASSWIDKEDSVMLSAGLITPYASSGYSTDFAETMANYIMHSPEEWNALLNTATFGWEIITTTKEPQGMVEGIDFVLETLKDDQGNVFQYKILRKQVERDENDAAKPVTNSAGEPVLDENGNYTYTYLDTDDIDGKEIIEKKVELIRSWLKSAWNIDLEELRNEVQKRKMELNVEELKNNLTKAPR